MLPPERVRCYAFRMARILGIDYGARRVGVALSDDGHMFAFAKRVLPNDDTLLDTIAQMAELEGVELIVVGEADNPAGGENTIQRRVLIFAEALRVHTGRKVETIREAYSSAEARRALVDGTRARSKTELPVDAAAAAIILQSYLDSMRHHALSVSPDTDTSSVSHNT